MNRVKILSVVVLLTFLIISSTAQTPKPSVAHPWEYGNVCWEDEKTQLNSLARQLLEDKESVGYIIVYAGRVSCPGEAKYRAERAKKWVVSRGVKSDRVIAKDGGYRIEVQTVLRVQHKSDPEVEPYSLLNKEARSIKRRCVDKVFARNICLNK